MFERILVPVDGSEGAMAALRLALKMQERFDSEILLLCVYRHYSLLGATTYMPTPGDYKSTDESMREHAVSIIDAAKNLAVESDANKIQGFVKGGPPARTIVNFSKEHEINLIVIGSRGLGDLEGFLLGSVSHKVTSLAGCPVLVV